jgi:hypothetical protein
VQVIARKPSVSLIFGQLIGKPSVEVEGRSIARSNPPTTTTVTVGGKSDIWLAGMPAGSHASWNDTTANATPLNAGIPLTPGTMITFTSVSGTVSHGTVSGTGPFGSDGKTGSLYNHGSDAPVAQPGAENGIADIVSPIVALLGVFIGPDAPNTTAAPARRDYSQASSRDRAVYDDILLKQPFFIGDGKTSGNVVQQFKVPEGATRLFLGPMDGHEWNNNSGSFTVTLTSPRSVSLVK